MGDVTQISTSPHNSSNTNIVPIVDQFVPVDEYGAPISDEGDPAFTAGALHAALECYAQDPEITAFLTKRTVQSGRYTIVDSKEAIPFAEDILAAPDTYSVHKPCPPTPLLIAAYDAKSALTLPPSPTHSAHSTRAGTIASIKEIEGQYHANRLAVTKFDAHLCKSLASIIQVTTRRLALVKLAQGSTASLITLIKAEETKLTSGQKTAAKTQFADFVREGFPGAIELDSFESHLLAFKKQVNRLVPAHRQVVDLRQEVEDMINLADEELGALLRIEMTLKPPGSDDEHLDLIRKLLRTRETNQKLRNLHGKTGNAGSAAAQHVLIATSLRSAGVNTADSARTALTNVGYAGTALETALAVWSTTRDPAMRGNGGNGGNANGGNGGGHGGAARGGGRGSGRGATGRGSAGRGTGNWVKAPRDADNVLTGWIEGMMPCNCGANTGGQPGALAGAGKHLQKTAGCGLLKTGDTPRVVSTKPTVAPAAEQVSNVVISASATNADGVFEPAGPPTAQTVTDGAIQDPAVLSQLARLFANDRNTVSIPVSSIVQQSNAVTNTAPAGNDEEDPGYSSSDFMAPDLVAVDSSDEFAASDPGYGSDDFVPNTGGTQHALVTDSGAAASQRGRWDIAPPSSRSPSRSPSNAGSVESAEQEEGGGNPPR